MTINALAAEMGDGPHDAWPKHQAVAAGRSPRGGAGQSDRRSKELRLTEAGIERLRTAVGGWPCAQERFDAIFGTARAAELRGLLHAVSLSDLAGAGARSEPP